MQEDAVTQVQRIVSTGLTVIQETGLPIPIEMILQIQTITDSAMSAVHADRRVRGHADITSSFGSTDTRPPPDAPPPQRRRRGRPQPVLYDPVPAADFPPDADIPVADIPADEIPPVHIDIPAEHGTPTGFPYDTHVGTSSAVPSRTDPQASASTPAEIDTQGEALTQVEGLTQAEGSPRAPPPRGRITYRRGRRPRGGRGRGDAVDDAGASQVTQDSLAAGRERRSTAGQRRGCGT